MIGPGGSDRKKPGVAFWATVVVAVVLAYPLSFGPACWWTAGHKTETRVEAFDRVYSPLAWAAYRSPTVLRVLYSYGTTGMPDGKMLEWTLERDGAHASGVVLSRNHKF